MKELKGLQITNTISKNGQLTLVLSNGKELNVFGEYNYINSNNFNFEQFNGTKFGVNILNELNSTYFSLKEVNQEMSVHLQPEDVLSFELSVDVTEETITLYARVPVDTLKGKTINWEDDWYDEKEEIEENNENLVEIAYIDLAKNSPDELYKFLKHNTTK